MGNHRKLRKTHDNIYGVLRKPYLTASLRKLRLQVGTLEGMELI